MVEAVESELKGIPDEGKPAFVLPIAALELLGGKFTTFLRDNGDSVEMVDDGACLFGVENLEKSKGIFNHSLLVGRKAWALARALRGKSEELGDGRYSDVNPNLAFMLGVFHDIVKLHSGSNPVPKEGTIVVGRENLTPAERQRLGISAEYREISPEADSFAVRWVEDSGLPPDFITEFKRVVVGHDFPQSEEAIETVYQRLIQVCDYSVAQSLDMTLRQRWNDVAARWVKEFVLNWGDFQGTDVVDVIAKHFQEFRFDSQRSPRIEPERLIKAVEITEKAAKEIYGYLGVNEDELNEKLQAMAMPPAERVIRKAHQRDLEHQKAGGKGAPAAVRVIEKMKRAEQKRDL